MGYPSTQASNAIIYLTYGFFLIMGLVVAWRKHTKNNFLAGIPLAFNFVASAMGCGILTTYPDVATIAGVQGLLVYGLSSSLPILLFALAGPAIRKRCPDGFVLTEWTRHRFGRLTALYLSFFTIATMFLYLVAELSAVQQAITALTGMDALPALIVECVVTTIYTSWGGFQTSFFTDNIQGGMIVVLLVVVSIAMGTNIDIDRSKIDESGLTKQSRLGWQLIYILPMAVATNDFFLSGFWLRTFASRSNRDLYIGCSIATVTILIFLTLVGSTGLVAAWSGLYNPSVDEDGSNSFFRVLLQMPSWVVGFVLVFVVSLSTAAFDSIQSAMASSISNDVFQNKLPIIWVRGIVVLIMVPSIVVALKGPSVLQIFLITDLISSAVVPTLILGLFKQFYWLSGYEVMVSGLGGILAVFIFGSIYYSSALEGAQLIILKNGLYVDDWSAFGAFMCAPFGGMVFGLICFAIRMTVLFIRAKVKHEPFTALSPPPTGSSFDAQSVEYDDDMTETDSLTKVLHNKKDLWI